MEGGRELIERARKGDSEARGELYLRFEEMLRAYLDRRTGPRLARAVSLSDLCQETFVGAMDALRVLPTGATIDDFRGILLRHARWMVGKQAEKHRGFRGESVLGDGVAADRVAGNEPSAGEVTRRDEASWLADLVEQLDPGQAAVVRLRLAGRSFADIAAELSIREGTARQRYLRGSRALRRMVEGR
jgi:RNA polymerase sigma-70 factor (ECF subfamily)